MNDYEGQAVYNLTDTCVKPLQLQQLLALDVNCMLITRRGESGTVKTAAVTDRTNRLLNALLATQNQSIELKPYSKISDCYNALISRQTDAVICTTASAAWIMNSHGMRKINVSSFPGVTLELSGCVRRESNILRSILNKGVSTMGADMQSIIASNTVAESGSLVAVLETASSEVLLIVFTGLVLLIIWLIVMLAENHKHQKEKSEILAAKARNEQRSLQLAAEEKATAEKDSFFSSISHDMRTPLNAIIGFSDLARKEPVTPAVDDYLAKIESSGKLLLELINDTLTISKINSGKMVMGIETETDFNSSAMYLKHKCGHEFITAYSSVMDGFGCSACESNLSEKQMLDKVISASSNGHYSAAGNIDRLNGSIVLVDDSGATHRINRFYSYLYCGNRNYKAAKSYAEINEVLKKYGKFTLVKRDNTGLTIFHDCTLSDQH